MLRLLCVLLLMASAAVAQQQPPANNLPEPNFKVQRSAPAAPNSEITPGAAMRMEHPRIVMDDRTGSAGGTCYTLRSYYFEQHDGSAPQRRGMTTCTPANRRTLRNAKGGSVQFVPLGVSKKSELAKPSGN